MKILVCGSRDYSANLNNRVVQVLNNHLYRYVQLIIIQGGATGVDDIARMWAENHHVPCFTYPAEWSLGPSAGPKRNKYMLNSSKPDLVLAFPGGKGTANMVSLAKKGGYRVEEVKL